MDVAIGTALAATAACLVRHDAKRAATMLAPASVAAWCVHDYYTYTVTCSTLMRLPRVQPSP